MMRDLGIGILEALGVATLISVAIFGATAAGYAAARLLFA